MITPGIEALAPTARSELLKQVRMYDQFEADHDPHGEHDFGSFDADGTKMFWKIDYYDRDVKFGSEDPCDPAKTTRILTVMLASEYEGCTSRTSHTVFIHQVDLKPFGVVRAHRTSPHAMLAPCQGLARAPARGILA